METKANYVIVGIFTVVAILAAFGFVYWTAAIGERGEEAKLRVRIPGSASGLGRGSAVLFNGVKVGDVERVYLDLSNPAVAIADARVDRLTPITDSTKADIGLAGLTGQANVELSGGNPSERNILDRADEKGRVAEITANPSAVTNLLQTAQSILTRADSVVSGLEGFVGETREPLAQTVRNIEKFSAALDRNADGIDKFLSSVGSMSDTLTKVSGRLDSTLASAEDLLNSVDREQVSQTMANIQQFTSRLDSSSRDLDQIMGGVNDAVASIDQFSKTANQTLSKVNGIVSDVDPAKVRTALANFEQMSATVNRAASNVAEVTDRIGGRTDDIDRFITDASQLASRLNKASTQVDDVLAKLNGMLGSDDANGVMADARKTLQSMRQVADTLNARIGPITEGLSRFSGQGLRDVEDLVRQSRRSIQRIEQAITSLEENPQRIITGGEGSVRRYDGGRVRR